MLYNSRQDNAKHFFKGGTFFGWKTIVRLWEREMEKSHKGQMVTVPRMICLSRFMDPSQCDTSKDYAGICTIIHVMSNVQY